MLALVTSARADVTYRLLDYPNLQQGATLSGSITVVDTAADDSLLQAAEIVHWTFTLTKGADTVTVDSTTQGTTLSLNGTVVITPSDILLPRPLPCSSSDNQLRLADYSLSPSISGGLLNWQRTNDLFNPCNIGTDIYRASDLRGTSPSEDDVTYWQASGPSLVLGNPDPWRIATATPYGACCNPTNGGCVVLSPADCAAFGGVFAGIDVACDAAGCTACPADFNNDGNVTVPDIFAFLAAWFSGCP